MKKSIPIIIYYDIVQTKIIFLIPSSYHVGAELSVLIAKLRTFPDLSFHHSDMISAYMLYRGLIISVSGVKFTETMFSRLVKENLL